MFWLAVLYRVCAVRSKKKREFIGPSLTQAIGLAKLYDDKFADSIWSSASWGDKAPTVVPHFLSHSTVLPPLLPDPSGPKKQFAIKKLTPAEMLTRWEKVLCYNCDDKFFVGHMCKGQLFIFFTNDVGPLEEGGIFRFVLAMGNLWSVRVLPEDYYLTKRWTIWGGFLCAAITGDRSGFRSSMGATSGSNYHGLQAVVYGVLL